MVILASSTKKKQGKYFKKKGKSTLCFPDERKVLLHIYLIMETDHPGKGCPV